MASKRNSNLTGNLSSDGARTG